MREREDVCVVGVQTAAACSGRDFSVCLLHDSTNGTCPFGPEQREPGVPASEGSAFCVPGSMMGKESSRPLSPHLGVPDKMPP